MHCCAKTNAGKTCKKNARDGSNYCSMHQAVVDDAAADVDAVDVAAVGHLDGWEHEIIGEIMEDCEDEEKDNHNQRILQLEQLVSSLRLDNQRLQKDLVVSKSLLEETQSILQSEGQSSGVQSYKSTQIRAPKPMTEKRIWNRAKGLFYAENKAHPTVLDEGRKKLVAGGLYYTKPVHIRHMTVDVEMIPWQYLREYTDTMFQALSQDEKQRYFSMATN
jgi:hypothetical protein